VGRHSRQAKDLDARAWESIDYHDEAQQQTELTCLRLGGDPPWCRPSDNGEDITLQPERQTDYQRARIQRYWERVEHYRAEGLL
jgi:hypothetical protein